MSKRIVIIDGNSLINRAYYAMQRPMITKDGVYTQGIYGFINMLNKIQDDYAPDYMAVAWDRKAPTFRHEEYKEYKAGRKKMPMELAMELPIMKDILNAMNIANLEIDGFEADDIIGTVARIAEEEGFEPLIITGDKDALQLATDITHVLITRKGITDFDLYDRDKMIERYQLTPEQFIDLKGLMGDQSDNIPGIPGVGEKTGIKLLTQFGSVSNLLANTDQIANEKLRLKVEENAQLAAMSRRLAEINKYVPLDINIEDYKLEEPDYDKLIDIYVKLEFNSFLKRLSPETLRNKEERETDEAEYEMITVGDSATLEVLNQLPAASPVIIKVFSDDNHVQEPCITGISILSGEKYYYVSVNGDSDMEALMIRILNEKKLTYIGHDLIKDYYTLMYKGLKEIKSCFDTAVAGYVLDPTKSGYDLKLLTFELLHYELQDEKSFLEESSQIDLLGNSDGKYADYGLKYCLAVKKIMEIQNRRLDENELKNVFEKIELPLIEVLAAMETEGFDADRDMIEQFGTMLKSEIDTLEQSIYELAGKEFNINSPSQLGVVLFEDLGLPVIKKTKRGYSTGAEILEKLKDKHPIIEMVLQYRTLTKLNSTYVEGLKPLIGKDGKIRAHFRQTVTSTGRISCTEPNLQNIPVKQELGRQLRKAFTGGTGTLVGADYSQIELRVLAHLSEDSNLLEAFNNGDDIHRNTASRVFNIPYDQVTSLDRSRAKAVNFGVIYGMSGFGLSENLNITRKEAEKYIADYFDKHKAVKAYMDNQIKGCRENGYTVTVMGRKRYIHEINSSNYMTRQLGERLAMNSPIQGSAADIIKLAMIKVYNELKDKSFKSKLILQVHDELIIKARNDEIEAVKELLVRNMEEAMSLKVKLESDLNVGNTWFDLK
ncbi:MAG: DNA polymerase I [Eubacteriaceae bacterium]|nr:DNA polymerase I [Eubacteriaceae bacterium]